MKYLIVPITSLLIVIGCQTIGTHIASLTITLLAATLYSITLLSAAAWLITRIPPPAPPYPYNIQRSKK